MSTKFTSVYDEIRTAISTLYSTKTEINNPYTLEENADIDMKDSWGIAIRAGSNSNRVLCGQATVKRNIEVSLLKRVAMPEKDVTARITGEKALFNDQLDMIKYFEGSPTTTNTVNVRFISDSGIEFLEGDRFGFLVLRSTLELEYVENV